VKDLLKLAAALAIVVGAAVGFALVRGPGRGGLQAGAPAPPLRLPALGGQEVDLQSFSGRVVLVNFWASWCGPCVEEMPSLENLYRTLSPRGLVVLGVAADEDEGALRAFLARAPVTFPVLRDPGGRRAGARFGVTGYPATFLVDGAGVIRQVFLGPVRWDTPAAVSHIGGLLAPPR